MWDPDGDPLTITALGLPAWMTLIDHGDGTAALIGDKRATSLSNRNIEASLPKWVMAKAILAGGLVLQQLD
jgi:hypothetical protein